MAPSARSRTSRGQVQPALKTNPFRVTKATKLNIQLDISKQKVKAIEEVICPEEQPQPKQNSKKRRRETLSPDRENEEVANLPQRVIKKARSTTTSAKSTTSSTVRQIKIQLHTPPPSSPESENLQAAFEELTSLHKSFTQALAVHYAHNGSRNAVSLADLIPAITRLWKRRTICQQDVQRMLALWEIRTNSSQIEREVEHKRGPFRLLVTGIGAGSQMKIEYVWTELGTFVENELHVKFERLVEKLQKFAASSSISLDTIGSFPLLRCQIGTQTQARKEKINSIRDQILHKTPSSEPIPQPQPLDLSKLDISDPSEPKPSARETLLKSRTLSLFDRLRAKQLANSNSATPTSGDLLRRRALHRIPDIIDVLRLKQARKLSSQFRADVHGSPSKTLATMMKVSFSLDALVQEIGDSGKTNIANDEIKECISILGCEVPNTWCNVYSSGSVKCVTLQGEGWRKEEVREWCEREISKIGTQ